MKSEDTLSGCYLLFLKILFFLLVESRYNFTFNSTDEDNEIRTQEFKFAHDRIQQAAYSLIPDEQRLKTHFQIGRILEKEFPKKIRRKNFTVVNQLNHGISFLNYNEENKVLLKSYRI